MVLFLDDLLLDLSLSFSHSRTRFPCVVGCELDNGVALMECPVWKVNSGRTQGVELVALVVFAYLLLHMHIIRKREGERCVCLCLLRVAVID